MVDEENWKNGILRSSSSAFSNSSCVFVEYYDCIHFTGFILLNAIRSTPRDLFGINFDEISIMSPPDLLKWYCNRRNRNFLIDLWEESHPGEDTPYIELNNFFEDQLTSSILHRCPAESIIIPILQHLLTIEFVKSVVVYIEGDICDGATENIRLRLGEDVQIVHGDLAKVLESIPQDTTYILSDAEKVLTLEECGKLDFASVLIPSNFRYNMNAEGACAVDFDVLLAKHACKVAMINLCGI